MKASFFLFLLLISGNAYASVDRITSVFAEKREYETVNPYFLNPKGTTTLAQTATAGTTTLIVNSATGAVVGEAVNVTESGHLFQSIVATATGTTIGISNPVDRTFTTSANVCFGAWNMNVDGSSTPVTYRIKPPAGVKYVISSLSGSMTDTAAMDETTFGGIPALTKPVYMYYNNDFDNTFFLVSNNAGFYEWGADTDYPSKVPAGTYAFRFRKILSKANETAISINGDDSDTLNVVIQDNLTGLTKFAITASGHVVPLE